MSLFNSTTQTTEPVTISPEQHAALNDLLAGIKNEQGTQKYTSVEEALKGASHAQTRIRELQEKLQADQAEMERLRVEASKAANIDDVVSKLAAQLQTKPQPDPAVEVKGLDEQTVLSLLNKTLEENKLREAARSNLAQVEQHLANKFGEKAKEAIAAKAQELGMAPEKLGELAATSPALVLQLFGTTSPSGVKLSTSTVNIPPIPKQDDTIAAPDYSLLAGPKATTKNQVELLHKIRQNVYKKYDVTE